MLCISLERSGVGQVKEWFVMCQNIAQLGTSLVVQWLRICLLMQRTWVWSLVWGDPTCRRAANLVRHSYGAGVLQLLKLAHREPKLCNIRSRCSEGFQKIIWWQIHYWPGPYFITTFSHLLFSKGSSELKCKWKAKAQTLICWILS